MSINLLEVTQSTLGPIFLSKAGQLFGLNENDGKSALCSILPTLLGGILNKASTKDGAVALYNAISDRSVDSHIVTNLPILLGHASNVSKLGEQGGKILGLLFGDKATGLGEHVAQLAGTPAAGTKSMLALAAPAIFGLLKSQIVGGKMSPHAFTSLLSSQAVHLEKSLPEKVLEWLGWGSLAGFVGGLGGKLSGALSGLTNQFEDLFDGDEPKKTLGQSTAKQKKKCGGIWKWLIPLALIALAALLLKSCQKPAAVVTSTDQPAQSAPAQAAPAAASDSLFKLTFNNGKATVTATVATEAEKAELLKQLEATYVKDKFTADIKVDAAVKPASWLSKIADLLKLASVPGAELNIKGADISLAGSLADPKLGLVDKLTGLFGSGVNVVAAAFNADAAIAGAAGKFDEAIKALTASGKCDADALSNALNLYVVNFASGAASIPAKDVTALKAAIPAVTACAKDGVKIEIGGHTDNQGDAAANLKLSESRANALKAMFVNAGVPAANISVKGYGDTNPVGDNNTEEGRFQNRRITYTKQ